MKRISSLPILIKKIMLRSVVRRIFIFTLMLVMESSYIVAPFAYAKENAPSGETKEFVSLITDTEPIGVDPYIGEGRGVKSVIPVMTDLSVSNLSANVVLPSRVHKLSKANYRPNEDIKVVIENGLQKEFKTELIDATGNKVAMETNVVETGAAKVITVEQPSAFRPGKYTLRISDDRGGVSEQDFSWGVLAVNPDKSIYAPKEVANLAIAVLDEAGDMVCDAQVELQITDPSGKMTSLSTDNRKVIINPECLSHDFTLKPDYETNYQVGAVGVYKMLLKAQTKNGAYNITDSFEVQNDAPFAVKRVTATRIYPPNVYPVTMEITANQDFEGTVSETVPSNFKIGRPGQEIKDDAQFDPTASKSADVKAPDNLPQAVPASNANIVAYNTVNNIQESLGGPTVLGASIPGIGMPFSGPFPITQEFGESLVNDVHDHDLYESFGMAGHDGIDFGMPEETPLLAVDDGKVLVAGSGDYGTTIILQHSWGRSYYGHLNSVDVKEGQDVTRGMTIGRSGNTGLSTGPHLHFGIKAEKNDTDNGYYGKVDPAYYLGMKQSAGAVLGVATKLEPEAPVSTDIKVLTWKVNVKKGETIKIGYNYLAPRISPQFYTLGPATFTDTHGKEVFHEIRKWQIASDALDYKFKRGSFTKANCTAPCTQSIGGVGFKPKAIIFEWTRQTAEGFTTAQTMGVGYATANGGAIQERSSAICSEDNVANANTTSRRSDTKSIMIHSLDCTPATGVTAEADFFSFDTDGFTINWTTNDSSAFIIHYTALGGADLSNAKAGTFTLTTTTGALAVTDPGFQPDFLMTMGTTTRAVDLNAVNGEGARLSLGYAASATKRAGQVVFTDDTVGTAVSRNQQRTDSMLLLLDNTGAQDSIVDFTSFDATGFTLNKVDDPLASIDIFYLALKGGQYDLGSLTQPTTANDQAVYTGFKPKGVGLVSTNAVAGTAIANTSSISIGGASSENGTAWCNDTTGVQCTKSWAARKKITFNNSASNEPLTRFPVLVALNSSRIDYGQTQASGQDLRFVDPNDPNTALSYEIESWNESGTSYVWVKVPQIDAGSRTDHIWMYYGNATASDGQDVAAVWDNNYKAVYHMDESSGTTNADSTANANVGTKRAAAEPNPASSGPIGPAQDFDGSNDYVRANDNNSLDIAEYGTVTAWINRDVTADWDAIVAKGDTNSPQAHNYALEIENTVNSLNFTIGNGTTGQTLGTSANLSSTTNNYFLGGSWDGTTMRTYVDGAQNSTAVQTVTPAGNAATLRLGEFGGAVDQFDGHIDEVRVSNITRSADWIEAEYVTGTDAMNTFGTAENQTVGSQQISQGSIWGDDRNGETTQNANMASVTSKAIRMAASPTGGGAATTTAEANMQSLDPTGFTLGWTTVDATARQVIYWAVGSVTASQEDYRWYKNANSITPGTALEDENSTTILAKHKPQARLRTSVSVGGNGLNASTQGFKLQYAAEGAEAAVGGTSDWCNDSTGVTCTAPFNGEIAASTPTDWCNDTTGVTCGGDWNARRKITFNNATSSAALTNFPVMVKLDSKRIDYNKTQSAGQDIRFVDPANPNVVLSHEIESWDEAGTSVVWVEVPQLDAKSKADSIWMYYGNSSIGDGQDASGTWDSNYNIVYHMDESSGNLLDSAGSAQDAVRGGSTVAQTTGKIGSAQDFSGTGRTATSNPSLPTGDFTYETWVYLDAATGDTIYMSSDGAVGANNEIKLFSSTDHSLSVDATTMSFGTQPPTSTWIHLTAVRSGGNTTLYRNGEIYASTLVDPSTLDFLLDSDGVTQCELFLGVDVDANCAGSLGGYLNGRIDEFRVSNTARNPDWIVASFLSENDQLATFGSEFSQNDVKQISTGWQYREKITFNNAASTENLTNFPVLVKLDASKIDYNKTQDDGGDLRFVDASDNTTVLSHQIESWDENGTSYVWVEVPQIDATSSTDYMYMYYGNTGVSNGDDPENVWNSEYKGVWHLPEDPSGGAPQHLDSTSTNNDLTNFQEAASTDVVTAKVGKGRQYLDDGDSRVNDNATLTPTGDMVVSGWIKLTTTASDATLVYKHHNGAPFNTYTLGYYGGDFEFALFNSVPTQDNSFYTGPIVANEWYYLVGVRSGDTLQLYVNGSTANTTAGTLTGTNFDSDGELVFANAFTVGQTHFLDEVRLLNDDRSAEWIEAEYLSMTNAMNTIGEETPYASAGTNTAGWTDVADIWCNDTTGVTCTTSWANRRKITINNQSSNSNLASFAVLVKLDSTRIDYTKTQNSGQDIRFIDPSDPTTALPHEIESWDESGDSFVWVQVPQLDANSISDSIWIYYGNASASAPATELGSTAHATGVWDSSTKSVYHMKESPATTCSGSNEICDATSNANDANASGSMTASDQQTGKIDGSIDFDGTNDNFAAADSSSLDITGTLTVSAWVRARTIGTTFKTIVIKEDTSSAANYALQTDAGGLIDFSYYAAGSYRESLSNTAVTTDTWHYITATYSFADQQVKIYIDGVLDATRAQSQAMVANTEGLLIGDSRATGNEPWDGKLDELRIVAAVRSDDWVRAEYLTGTDQMNSFGNEETQTSSVWKFKDNAGVTNGTTITTAVLGTSATGNQMTYQETNPSSLNPTALAVGEKREFDFSLDGALTSNRRTYYFRIVTADGTPLTSYTRYPSITVGAPNQKVMRGGKYFNYKQIQPFAL